MEKTSPEAVGFSSQRLHRINALMQEYIDRKKLAGLITAVARRGQIAHLECFGKMDVEASKPMPVDAIFRIFSMTKPITTIAALMLYEEGHFQLDDPVSRFIPAIAGMKVYSESTATGHHLVEQERPMTIRDLFLHTSGLPYDEPDGSPVEVMYHQADISNPESSLHQMVQKLGKLPLASQPGSIWRYGLSSDVLGYLVEVIADMPFDEFLEQRIFSPLVMKDTSFYVRPENHGRLTAVYGPAEGGGIVRLDINRHSEPRRFLSGGGGLVSTTADYLRFAQMLLNRGELDGVRLLSRKTMELMTINHLPPRLLPYRLGPPELDHITLGHGWGLGVRVLMDVTQVGWLGSEGEYGWGGYANTMFWVDPKEEIICLFMTQFIPPHVHYPVERQFKVLVYQAIVD